MDCVSRGERLEGAPRIVFDREEIETMKRFDIKSVLWVVLMMGVLICSAAWAAQSVDTLFAKGPGGGRTAIWATAPVRVDSQLYGMTKIVTKAANYTVVKPSRSGGDLSGTQFNAITGAVTFTLPDPATVPAGVWYRFVNTVDANMAVSCANKVITDGNAAASSVTYSTSSHKIGGACIAICDGTKWIVMNTSSCTATVA